MKTPFVLSWIIVTLAVVASIVGVTVPGMYRNAMWQGFGFGNDLVTMLLGVPVLAVAMVRRSLRARLVWIGALCYMAYNYAFYLFGAPVNRLFVPYAALFALSFLTLAFALARTGPEPFRPRTPARWIAVNMFLFAAAVGVFWAMPWVKYVAGGEIPNVNGNPDDYRFIAAADLAFLVAPFLFAATWLWQRKPWGFVLATAVNVQFGMYSVVLITTCLMSRDIGALPVWIGLGGSCWLSMAGLLPNAPTYPALTKGDTEPRA